MNNAQAEAASAIRLEHMRTNPSSEDIWRILYERYGNICGSAKLDLADGELTLEEENQEREEFYEQIDHLFGANLPAKVKEFKGLLAASWQSLDFYSGIETWLENFRLEVIANQQKG